MKSYRVVGAFVIVIGGIAAYCNGHRGPQANQFNQLAQPQTQTAEFGAAARPDPRQFDESIGQSAQSGQPDQNAQPGQDSASFGDSMTSGSNASGGASYSPVSYNPAGQAGYGQAGYGQANYGAAAQNPASQNASWSQQTGGDRSATVMLPASWRLSNIASGTTIVEGPNREQVVLGLTTFVAPNTRNYAPYMPPVQALQWFTRSQGVQLVRVLDHSSAGQGNQGGQAEFIVAETQTQDGTRYKALALVMTNPMQMNIWKFHISYIAAPEGQFDAEAETMKTIWKSWKLDGGYVQGSMNDAQRRVNDTAAMMNQHILQNQRNNANTNAGISQALRGVTTYQNDSLGQRYEVPIGGEQQYENNCIRQGQDCHQVPTNQLVQPQ